MVIAVIGAGSDAAAGALLEVAESVGREIAGAGATLVCGGLGGVMLAAARGAQEGGGRTVGILPGTSRGDANPYIDIAIPTGLGEARNVLVVRAADAVVAVGGEYGTLSEIGLALKLSRPVIGINTWELRRSNQIDAGIHVVADAAAAVAAAMAAAARRRPPH